MNEQARVLFRENFLGVLATVNSDGSPRATPVHLVSDDEAVYWLSSEQTIHSQNITRDPRVSVTLFSPDTSGGPKAVYVHGQAEKLDEAGRILVRDIFEERLGSIPSSFQDWSAYRLSIRTLDEQKSTGGCWYFYS